jgi:O-antigen/teichoic acid export membrane protein
MYAVLTLSWMPFLLYQMVGVVLQPHLSKLHHEGQTEEVRGRAGKMIQWSTLSCLVLCAGVYAAIRLFLAKFLGEAYDIPAIAAAFLTLSCYYHVVLYLNSVLAAAEGRARAVFISNAGSALTNVCLCMILVSPLGIRGVTLALASAFFVGAALASAANQMRGARFFRGYWLSIMGPGMLFGLIFLGV